MFFVVSWNAFLAHLAINLMVKKNMQMHELPDPNHNLMLSADCSCSFYFITERDATRITDNLSEN